VTAARFSFEEIHGCQNHTPTGLCRTEGAADYVECDGDIPIGGRSPVPLAMEMGARLGRQSPERLGLEAIGLQSQGEGLREWIRRLLAGRVANPGLVATV
jgi:hypothetical protein